MKTVPTRIPSPDQERRTPSTIVSTALRMARQDPTRVFAIFRTRECRSQMSYGELTTEGRRVATAVSRRRPGRQRVVIIMLPQGPELMTAFFGTMLAGHIPSLFPTNDSRVHVDVLRQSLTRAVETSGATLLITDEASKARFFAEQDSPVPLLTPGEWAALPATFSPPLSDSKAVAFLQHSSGTTGQKKGVAITHGALLRQADAYARAIDLKEKDVIASWLPLYHDMGLIACFLMPLVRGVPVVTLDPFEWVSDPALLLHAISEERASLAWLPNFAYLFMAKRVRDQDVRGVRLDSLRALINCSEPITEEAHRAFRERFAPLGFRESALSSCYAMAENTFAVTQNILGQSPRTVVADTAAFLERGVIAPANPDQPSRAFVSSGKVVPNTQVRLVDPHTGLTKQDALVGEITLTSDCMLDGYFHSPELTAEALREGWYHTGDLGFLHDGELFVTGRKKDLIIVAGKNLYPQDVEAIASEVSGVHPGRVVAFGVFDEEMGTENLVVLAETKDDAADRTALSSAIQADISTRLQCSVHRVAVVDHGTLLKSTSGKISRSKCREAFVEGAFEADPEPTMSEPTELTAGTDANAAVKRAYAYAAALEIVIQFSALSLPALLLLNAPEHPLLFTLCLMGAFYGYVLGLLALVGGISRMLPRPQPGILNEKDLARWALLISLHMLARRGPARWYGWCFPPAHLYFRLCGARIAPNVMVSSLDGLPEPYMVEIGSGTTLGDGCLVSAHYVPRVGSTTLGPIKIGKNVLVGRAASVWGNVTIGDGAVIQERSSVMPGTVIPPGEIWGGIPARPLIGRLAPEPSHVDIASLDSRDGSPGAITAHDVDAYIQELLHPGSERRIDPSITLAETGAVDSLSYLSLVRRVEERYRVSLDTNRLSYRNTSIEDLVGATTAKTRSAAPIAC